MIAGACRPCQILPSAKACTGIGARSAAHLAHLIPVLGWQAQAVLAACWKLEDTCCLDHGAPQSLQEPCTPCNVLSPAEIRSGMYHATMQEPATCLRGQAENMMNEALSLFGTCRLPSHVAMPSCAMSQTHLRIAAAGAARRFLASRKTCLAACECTACSEMKCGLERLSLHHQCLLVGSADLFCLFGRRYMLHA